MKVAGVKIQPWMLVAAGVGVLWWMSRPKTVTGATGTATGAASGFDAGRHPHGGGHHHHGGRRGVLVSPSYTFVGNDYAGCECARWVCPPEV